MKIAYFDFFSGASGDMILGALVDAGLSANRLRKELGKLPLAGYEIRVEPAMRCGIGASRVCVDLSKEKPGPPLRHLADIEGIVNQSGLDKAIRARIISIFRRLAHAEARVHRTGVEEVHFHEVGAVDAVVDVAGAVIGLSALGIGAVYASPIHLGSGTVECAHGTIPVPAPAALELVRDIPVYGTGLSGEMLTPTGAAILSSVCASFGPLPPMVIEAVGYGAGTAKRAIPNLLRLAVGRPMEKNAGNRPRPSHAGHAGHDPGHAP